MNVTMIPSLPNHLNKIIDCLPGAIGIKDLNSTYIAGNNELAMHMGYDNPEKIIGLKDTDIKNQMAELASDFIQQDKTVVEHGEEQHIDIGRYCDGEIQIHFSTKKPLYDEENQIIGTIFSCFKMQNTNLFILKDHLEINRPGFYEIGGLYDKYNLSSRESECLFFLIRGYTAKEIARRLNLSAKTIEYYIDQIKSKLSCLKKSELIEKAIDIGFIFNIPSKLIKKNS